MSNSPNGRSRFEGWGLPMLIGAVILIGGLLLFATEERKPATKTGELPAQTTDAVRT